MMRAILPTMRRTFGTVLRSLLGMRELPELSLVEDRRAVGLVIQPRQRNFAYEERTPRALPAPRGNGCGFFEAFAPEVSHPEGGGERASYRAEDVDGIVNNDQEAVAVFDEKMCYLQANQRWVEELGLTAKTYVGRSQYEIFPTAHDNWRRIFQRALEGGSMCRKAAPRSDVSERGYHWEVRPWRRPDARIGGIVVKWGRDPAPQTPPPLPPATDVSRHLVVKAAAIAEEAETEESRALSLIPETSGDLYWQSRLHIVALNAKGRVLRKSEGAAGLFSGEGGERFLWEAYGEAKDDPDLCKAVLAALKGVLRNPTAHSLLSVPLKHTYIPWEAPLHWQLSIARGPEWGEQGFAILAVGVSSAADGPLADVAAKEEWQLPEPAAAKSASAASAGRALSGVPAKGLAPARRPVPVTDEAAGPLLLSDAPGALALPSAKESSRGTMLQYIPDVIPCGIAVVDVEGCCIYQNSVLAMLLGRRIYEGQRMEDYLAMACRDERHRRQVSSAWRETVWSRQAPHRFSLVSADGQMRHMELRPSLLPGGHLLISFQEVAEESPNQRLLESSEKNLRQALLQVPMPVLLSDLNGTPHDVNDGIVELLGFGNSEWPGLTPDSWLSLSSQAARRAAFRRSTQEARQSFAVELYHRDGSEWRAMMQVCLIADIQGDPLLFAHYIMGAEKIGQDEGGITLMPQR